MFILYIMGFLVGLIAHQKGKNGIAFGLFSFIAAFGISAFFIYIEPVWNLVYKIGMSGGIYTFSAFFVGGGFYNYLRGSKIEKEEK